MPRLSRLLAKRLHSSSQIRERAPRGRGESQVLPIIGLLLSIFEEAVLRHVARLARTGNAHGAGGIG